MQRVVSFQFILLQGDLLIFWANMDHILAPGYVPECCFVCALCGQGSLEAICQIISVLKLWCSLWGKCPCTGRRVILWTLSKLGKRSWACAYASGLCTCACFCCPFFLQQGASFVLVRAPNVDPFGAFWPKISGFRIWKIGSHLEPKDGWVFHCEQPLVWRGSSVAYWRA